MDGFVTRSYVPNLRDKLVAAQMWLEIAKQAVRPDEN